MWYCVRGLSSHKTQINEDFEAIPEERSAYAAVSLWTTIGADHNHRWDIISLHAFSWAMKDDLIGRWLLRAHLPSLRHCALALSDVLSAESLRSDGSAGVLLLILAYLFVRVRTTSGVSNQRVAHQRLSRLGTLSGWIERSGPNIGTVTVSQDIYPVSRTFLFP